MDKKQISICGMGAVGKAVSNLIPINLYNVTYYDINGIDTIDRSKPIYILHYTVPFVEMKEWLDDFYGFVMKHKPKIVIIESTIVPDVVDLIKLFNYNGSFFYSPIRATERIMKEQIKMKKKYIAPIKYLKEDLQIIRDYFNSLYKKGVSIFSDAKALVLGKLFETTQFGVNIALVKVLDKYCKKEGISFIEAYNLYMSDTEWAADYSSSEYLARTIEPSEFIPRPIFRPGKIGGKCVMQNIDLLRRYVDEFGGILKWVEDINDDSITWSMGQVELKRPSIHEKIFFEKEDEE